MNKKVSFIIGTRPELIKVAPVIMEMRKHSLINTEVVNTAQHKDLLDPYWKTFNILPDKILDVMNRGQNLTSLTSRALTEIQGYLDNTEQKPDAILAQGDTTTVMAAAMVAFYNNINFVHLEAGLRSWDFSNPFPEEYNRRVASIASKLHLCPTDQAVQNLINEGIASNSIIKVGNTVIDALELVRKSSILEKRDFSEKKLGKTKNYSKKVLITCHRRENHGYNLEQIIEAILCLCDNHSDTLFIWAIHPNPNVKDVILSSELKNKPNVLLLPPLDYLDLIQIMEQATCVISDSGGIQEEAPSFKVPVIVLREHTERPEGVEKGLAFLTGASKDKIIRKFEDVTTNYSIDFGDNPYGDGKSSQRVVKALNELLSI